VSLPTPKFDTNYFETTQLKPTSLYSIKEQIRFQRFICYSEEYLIRFLIQSIMFIILFQLTTDTHTILKAYFSRLIIQFKSKFKHYIYDLGIRFVVAVTMFTCGLCFSILAPVTTPISALMFMIGYFMEKYNLFFVYPLDFESEVAMRKTLVLSTFWAIVLFQFIMICVLSSVLQIGTTIQLSLLLLVQLVVFAILLEFFRSPWKGQYLKVEEAWEIHN